MALDRVLLIDHDAERASYLATVLEFVDCQVERATPENWEQALGERDRLLAVVVGQQAADGHLGLTDRVHAKCPEVALLTAVERGGAVGARGSAVLGSLEVPASYTQVSELLHKAQIFRESREGRESRRPVDLFRSLVGNSRAIQRVRRLIEQVADSDATVLILGESGTGKEVVARNLHYHSARRHHPFVPVNCGAIPGELLESELFGHEKGAFTGAISARQGRFELAEGGTLFLDEIGDMSLTMQVKLLRVLQERTFERVGSNKTITCNVRIIAATHRDLEEAIRQSAFREDLFYRLNVFPIEMPPLRDRIEDVPLLVNELIARMEHEKRGSLRLTPSAVMALCQYRWPGNVRELANLIERLAILHPYGVVDVADLPEKFRPEGVIAAPQALDIAPLVNDLMAPMTAGEPRLPREGLDLREHISHLEISLIRQALDQADGVVAHAARRLRMRRTTLVEKMRKYGLARGDETAEV